MINNVLIMKIMDIFSVQMWVDVKISFVIIVITVRNASNVLPVHFVILIFVDLIALKAFILS